MLILDRIVDQPGLLMVDVSLSLLKMFFGWILRLFTPSEVFNHVFCVVKNGSCFATLTNPPKKKNKTKPNGPPKGIKRWDTTS
jgi:hypothetical protein